MKISFLPKHWLLVTLGLIFAGYVLFQARYLILGPQVWIDSPQDGAVVSEPVIAISGRARNAAWISLDGRQIFTDEKGLWSEKLILAEGLSIMTARVRDRFGRETSKNIRIIFNG
ncbi:MAG: Ig-like domain-containing protein [Candidatus Zambryskibacteria bacterium]|nr:Ig-like domain-containing protein [Candidatus Zambryskibacteria bacterium]